MQLRQHINEILRVNVDGNYGEADLWLADTYENLPDFQGPDCIDGTRPTVDASWQSPFKGQSLARLQLWFATYLNRRSLSASDISLLYRGICKRDKARCLSVRSLKVGTSPRQSQSTLVGSTWVNGYKRDSWRDDWKK